jgi:hypothetical protein
MRAVRGVFRFWLKLANVIHRYARQLANRQGVDQFRNDAALLRWDVQGT